MDCVDNASVRQRAGVNAQAFDGFGFVDDAGPVGWRWLRLALCVHLDPSVCQWVVV
jgi:hypothetical protein